MKIKVFIPSYARPDRQKTYGLLKGDNRFDVKVVVHNLDEYEKYKIFVEEKNLIVSNARLLKEGGGISEQRNFIHHQVDEDEWYVVMDDDIAKIQLSDEKFATIQEIPTEMLKENSMFSEKRNDADDFFSAVCQVIDKCESEGYRIGGLDTMQNCYFKPKKWSENKIPFQCMFIKKSKDHTFHEKIQMKEDIAIFADYVLLGGGSFVLNHVMVKASIYDEGGCGKNVDERDEYYRVATDILLSEYQGFFTRNTNKKDGCTDVLHQRNPDTIKKWRLYMITQGKLPKEYAIKILGERQGKKFLETIKTHA